MGKFLYVVFWKDFMAIVLSWKRHNTKDRTSSKTAIFQTVGELSCQVFEEEPPLLRLHILDQSFNVCEVNFSSVVVRIVIAKRKMPLSRSHCFKNAFANRPVIMFSSCHCVTSLEDFFSHTLNVLQNWPRLRTSCSCCSEENIIIFLLCPCLIPLHS